MTHSTMGLRKSSLIAVSAFLSGLVLAGCDEYVQITRDPDVPIHKLATWAWRPVAEQAKARDSRAVVSRDVVSRDVVSRDVISRDETVVRDSNADNEMVRQRVKTAIEQTLASKGLTPISDPKAAEFLVDYHFAVERRNVTVPAVYGGYPGVVCGPFGCWQSWGWGPAAVGYEHIHLRQGTIVFDFIQASTKHLVYRAVGEKPVHSNTFSLTQGDIHGLVHLLLKDLRTYK